MAQSGKASTDVKKGKRTTVSDTGLRQLKLTTILFLNFFSERLELCFLSVNLSFHFRPLTIILLQLLQLVLHGKLYIWSWNLCKPRCGRETSLDIYVVKCGPYVSENEDHALLFLGRNLSIPAPRLYITGPFGNEQDFSKAMSLPCSQYWTENGLHGWLSDFFARNFPSALSGHQPNFTYRDLYRRNIPVRKVNNEHLEIDNYEVVAIVDWESVGWYPAYWESASSFALFQWIDDWPERFEKIIDPCYRKVHCYAWYNRIWDTDKFITF